MNWTTFVKTLLTSTFLGVAVIYAWILLVDPYDDVWFSPPFEREPVSKNQRFSYPAIARNPRFDSLVVGTSSVRLLQPSRLDPQLGAVFANLAMNSATPYEQSQILELFARHHPTIRYALFGVDETTYCDPHAPYSQVTDRPFPPWMYDENRFNDLLYLFNAAAVEMAWRQFRNMLGLRKPRFGRDGYANFLPPESKYDLEKARAILYSGLEPHVKPAVVPEEHITAEESAGWTFPNLAVLAGMLRTVPPETRKVVILPPYPHFRLPAPGSKQAAVIEECKVRIAHLAETIPNSVVIDFWQRSRITLNDENYWDSGHYKVSITPIFEEAIVSAVLNGRAEAGFYDVMTWSDRPAAQTTAAGLDPPQPGSP